MIQKFAAVEEILEVKSSKSRLNYNDGANEKLRFAKFAAMSDGVRREDDYLYVRCRAISSRVNKNNDGWPSEELSKSYKTFENRPIFVDHNNDNPKRTRGVIVASDLHTDEDRKAALDPYYATAPDNHKPPTWVELLLEVDAKTYPKLAARIEKGELDAVSMGANIETSTCSVCAHEAATPSEYCKHIKQKGLTFEVTSDNGEKIKKKAYEDCYGINFFEISFVFDPADPTADAGRSFKGSSLQKKAAEVGVNFDEVRHYLESRGEKVDTLSDMVGKTLPMQHVAALKRAAPDVEQFMVPSGQDAVPKNKNYTPRDNLITAPEHVDTLRDDSRCPVCHAAEMETGADGVLSCPICGHVQEPEPLNNPDLEVARDNALRQDNATPEQNVLPVDQADPLDAVQFDTQQEPGQLTSKRVLTTEGISEMFTVKLRTESREEADKVLPAKVARKETKLGAGIHRGIYDAAREAGLKVKVAYPGVKGDENSVEVPGNNGIFNLFFAEESAINLKVPMADVPVVVEAATEADADKFIKIMAETPMPSRRAGNDKKPLLPNSKPSDEPKKETIVSDPSEPVESKLKEALSLDGIVELDGTKYKLEEIKDEEEEESEEAEESKDDAKDEKDSEKADEKGKEIEEPTAAAEENDDDRESRLLAAFKLADLSVEMGLVEYENKMAFIAELEEESLERLNAREATLNSVKTAGLSKRSERSLPNGVRRVPRLSHAVPSMNGNTPDNDTPIEALFL